MRSCGPMTTSVVAADRHRQRIGNDGDRDSRLIRTRCGGEVVDVVTGTDRHAVGRARLRTGDVGRRGDAVGVGVDDAGARRERSADVVHVAVQVESNAHPRDRGIARADEQGADLGPVVGRRGVRRDHARVGRHRSGIDAVRPRGDARRSPPARARSGSSRLRLPCRRCRATRRSPAPCSYRCSCRCRRWSR